MTRAIAGICVLDNPFHVDGIYDYLIPEEMEDSVEPGRLVTVPFGISNHQRVGVVVEVRDHSAYKEAKMIRTLCPETLALDAEQLGILQFLKYRVLSPTGDAVRAMLPVSAMARLRELYAPVETPPEVPAKMGEIDRRVYDYLRANGETDLTALRKLEGLPAEGAVRRLRAKGLITRRVEFAERREGTAVRFWSLAVSGDKARELAAGREVEEEKISNAKQRAVLSVLLEEGEPMPEADLCGQAGVTAAPLKTLAKRGILLVEEKTVGQNPYTDVPYTGMTPQTLNEEQTAALETLWSLAREEAPRAALLQGVTGSGKTRVMTALIDRLLEAGKGVIVLLPEIALTPQSVAIFCARYGERVAVIHSALSSGERYTAYCRIRRGEADVVIGTRSAIFAPVRNLGAIIIDEEQEHTYKSDANPKYHARDIARYRCNYHKALMLLASATPSLESAKKAREGVYTEVKLTKRYGGIELPAVQIVDMRTELREGSGSLLSRPLCEAIGETLGRGEQCILFLNRRGYNRTVSCRSCGKPLTCPNCSVAMTYHTLRGNYREGEMVCHWCGKRLPVPARCPDCGGEHLSHIGFGTQRVEEELKILFGGARVLRMDTDTTTTKHAYEEMLGKFRRREADVLLGTQMVTKGHDFPDVTLVGVLLADTALYMDDYRAGERTFALLTQVIGRAGRRDRPGRAIIQTVNPGSEVIRLACEQNFDNFYDREIKLRKLLCFPPFCDIALITVSAQFEQEVIRASRRAMEEMTALQKETYGDVQTVVFGPFEAPVYRVDNKYRMRIVVKCRLSRQTYLFFAELLTKFGTCSGHRVQMNIDFNPSSL